MHLWVHPRVQGEVRMNWKDSHFYVIATIVFILLCILMLLFMLPRPAGAQYNPASGTFVNAAAIAYEPGTVWLWSRYCVDNLHPFGVRVIVEPDSSIEYPHDWITCQTKGTDFKWHHSWGQWCWAISPLERMFWLAPWSKRVACLDEGQ